MPLKIVRSVDNIRRFNSFNRVKHTRTLETIGTPDDQIKRIKEKNLKLVQGEHLYKHGIFDFQNKLYEGYDEMEICCNNDNSEIVIDFLTAESYKKLVKANYSLVHLGLMVFTITGLHRLGLGTKLALSLVDTRQIDNMAKAQIATAEVDMTNNFEITYMIPGFLVTIDTLYEKGFCVWVIDMYIHIIWEYV